MKPIARSGGRSSVAAAAYRAGERLTNARDGLVHDFRHKKEVMHAEIVLPEGVDASWAKNRNDLWNAAELAEKRSDARTAREFEVALPHELDSEQRLELTRSFSQYLADRYGAAVDFAIHAPQDASDIRNHHAHILMTTRTVGADGLGDKTLIERSNRRLLAEGSPTSHLQLRDIRRSWEQISNRALALAGHDIRIDHRSHQDRGLEISPTEHMGVHATQLDRQGLAVSRSRLDPDAARYNAQVIQAKPEQVLTLITDEKSVFDRHDIARTLHRYIDDIEAFQGAFAKVMTSGALVELQKAGPDGSLARYSTKAMIKTERGMVDDAQALADRSDHQTSPRHVQAAMDRQDAALQKSAGASLSDEQRQAIRHITGPERAAAIVGLAGAGKSTMLYAARDAWEAQGYRVHGAALAGKAAEGLEESSGISSRTLASYEMSWKNGRNMIGRDDVFVIDEAGMVGSKQLARFVGEVRNQGGKIVLVGDPEQLQPINAGAGFRAIAKQIGCAELSDIRRQQDGWQRQASQDFAQGRTEHALKAYADRGAVQFSPDRQQAINVLVSGYMADRNARGDQASRIALAHRRDDVQAINDSIREARKRQGALTEERSYQTANGERSFAVGDRILFTENNRDLGVKNGLLGTMTEAHDGRVQVRLDDKTGAGQGRAVAISMADYAGLDHGYAITIHRSQGSTVSRSFVLASDSMDRNIAYVAATRHRHQMRLYAPRDECKDLPALATRLGRDRSKETTLDYDPPKERGSAWTDAFRRAVAGNADGQARGTPGLAERAERIRARMQARATRRDRDRGFER